MALMRVYCGLAASEPIGAQDGNGWLTAAVVDDAGRLLDVCDIGDDATGYAELGALLAERSGGPNSVAVAADSDEHHVTLLLAAAGRPLAIVDDEDLLTDYADRFGDDDSADELDSGPSERAAVGIARALAAGALAASAQNAPRELMALKPVLSAHAAMAAGRHGTAVALREVLRELYPAALRAYPDPAEPIPLAILDALPEPGLLGPAVAGRGRDADVVDELSAKGVADTATLTDALTALRVAIAETPRRTGIGKGTTTAIAETIREAVAAVRACDGAIHALVGLLADKGASAPMPIPAPVRPAAVTELTRPPIRRGRPAPVREVEPPAPAPAVARPSVRVPAARPTPSRPAARVAPAAAQPVAQPVAEPTVAPAVAPRTPVQPPAVVPMQPQQPQPQPRVAPQPAAAAHVPPPPPGITPISRDRAVPATHPKSAPPQPVQPAAAATPVAPTQTPVTPMWSAEPVVSYTQAGPVPTTAPPPPTAYERYADAPQAGSYSLDPSYDAPAYPLAPDVAAPGNRDTWPINPPSYDDEAVRARTGSFSYQQAPAEAPIPRQRDGGRVPPPWQDDMAIPAEPPSLRLVDRDRDLAAPTAPVLRLVGNDAQRSSFRPDARPEPEHRPYTPEPRQSSTLDDSDGDLLIFAQAARSAWFEWPAEEEQPVEARPTWTDIDAGWSVAARAEHPEVEEHTEIGLPRRVPQANLVPGSPLPPMADDGLRIVRDPASMAAHTTGYFRGSRRGEEVRGYAVGGRSGLESGGGWDFSRDGWDTDRDAGYRSAANR